MAGKVLDETGLAELWNLVKAEDAKNAKIVCGSYVGTGTGGVNSPNVLNFEVAPTMVMMLGDLGGIATSNTQGMTTVNNNVMSRFCPSTFTTKAGFSLGAYSGTNMENKGRVTNNGKTYEWYCQYATTEGVEPLTSSAQQFNTSGKTYWYVAFYE